MPYIQAKVQFKQIFFIRKINLMQLFQLKQIAFFHLLVPKERKVDVVKKQLHNFFINNTVVIPSQVASLIVAQLVVR
jgi:hypothetical protein